MGIIYKDKAGNKLIKNDFTGVHEARNNEGKLVNKKGFETLAKRAGYQGIKEVKHNKNKMSWF